MQVDLIMTYLTLSTLEYTWSKACIYMKPTTRDINDISYISPKNNYANNDKKSLLLLHLHPAMWHRPSLRNLQGHDADVSISSWWL